MEQTEHIILGLDNVIMMEFQKRMANNGNQYLTFYDVWKCCREFCERTPNQHAMLATDRFFNLQVFVALNRLEKESKYITIHRAHDKTGEARIQNLALTPDGAENLLHVQYMTVEDAEWKKKMTDLGWNTKQSIAISTTPPAIPPPSGTPPAANVIKQNAGDYTSAPPSPIPQGGDVFKKAIEEMKAALQ